MHERGLAEKKRYAVDTFIHLILTYSLPSEMIGPFILRFQTREIVAETDSLLIVYIMFVNRKSNVEPNTVDVKALADIINTINFRRTGFVGQILRGSVTDSGQEVIQFLANYKKHHLSYLEDSDQLFPHQITEKSLNTIQTFHKNIENPFLRMDVILGEWFIRILLQKISEFSTKISGSGEDYGCYFSKKNLLTLGHEHAHAFLLFTKKEDPSHIYVIVKANIQIGKDGEGRLCHQILYNSGAIKQVKLYSLLLTVGRAEEPPSPDIGPGFVIEKAQPIVTFSRPANYNVSCLSSDKKDELFKFLRRNTRDFLEWEVIEFSDRRHEGGFNRALAYQPAAGESCGQLGKKLYSWTLLQRIIGVFSFLSSIQEILEKNYWPGDLKFDNMCIDIQGKQFVLKIIDFMPRGGSTFSLYKTDRIRGHSKPFFQRTLHNYQGILDNFHRRGLAYDEFDFKRVLFQFFFEILYNIFFILNVHLIESEGPKYYFLGWWESPLRGMEQITKSDNSIASLLDKYTFNQETDKDISSLVTDFLKDIKNELVFVISGDPGLNSFLDNWCSEAKCNVLSGPWMEHLTRLIVDFPSTPSPFGDSQLNIRKLKSIE